MRGLFAGKRRNDVGNQGKQLIVCAFIVHAHQFNAFAVVYQKSHGSNRNTRTTSACKRIFGVTFSRHIGVFPAAGKKAHCDSAYGNNAYTVGSGNGVAYDRIRAYQSFKLYKSVIHYSFYRMFVMLYYQLFYLRV